MTLLFKKPHSSIPSNPLNLSILIKNDSWKNISGVKEVRKR